MSTRGETVMKLSKRILLVAALLTVPTIWAGIGTGYAGQVLLNVSYDPTRELYKDYNAAFAKYWRAEAVEDISLRMTHGGSGKQARAVIDGVKADVVTVARQSDIDASAELSGKIAK